jgi:hypothetical protein
MANPTAVNTILFPCLTDQIHYSLHEVSPALGLARLIEENVEQWDSSTYETTIDLLTSLSRQVNFFDLLLPRGQALDKALFDALQNPY